MNGKIGREGVREGKREKRDRERKGGKERKSSNN